MIAQKISHAMLMAGAPVSTLAWPEAAGNCSDEDDMGNRAAMNR
jgi:hypothetical protein